MTSNAAVHGFFKTRKSLARNASAHPLDIIKIKSALGTLGHYDAPEWGVSQFPDSDLFQAIKAFQKTQGLKSDGVMKPDGETLAALSGVLHGDAATTAVQTAAQALQDLGRNGDEILAHISPEEAQLLHDITDGGSINPQTGLLEFSFGRESRSFDASADHKSNQSNTNSSNSNFGESQTGRSSSQMEQTAAAYKAKLDKLTGWERFVFGSKYGYQNFGSKQQREAINAKRAQEKIIAKAQQAKAELAKTQQLQADRRAKSQRDAAEQDQKFDRIRSAISAQQDGNIQTGMFETNAPSAQAKSLGFTPSVAGPIAKVTLSTFAPSTPPNKNGYMASSPASSRLPSRLSGSIPGMTGSATPAQQARNVKAFQAYQDKKAKEEAKAREDAFPAREVSNLFAGIDFADPLGAFKSQNTFGPSVQVADASGNMGYAASLTSAKPKARTYTPEQLAAATQSKKSTQITHARIKNFLDSKRAHQSAGETFNAAAQKTAWNEVKNKPTITPNSKNMLRYPGLPPRNPRRTLSDLIAQRETKDQPNFGYGAVNGDPNVKRDFALGRYQMRSSALEATKYLDKKGEWIGKDGINSYQDFLGNPDVQEKAIKAYQGVLGTELSSNGSTKHLGQKIDGIKAEITITRSGLVAAAHRQGARKVREYLKHMKDNGWKSDFRSLDKKTRDAYLSVETRLRELQNAPLP